jgi:hypothetical protein
MDGLSDNENVLFLTSGSSNNSGGCFVCINSSVINVQGRVSIPLNFQTEVRRTNLDDFRYGRFGFVDTRRVVLTHSNRHGVV